jgi:hypothetical protein
MLNRARYKGYFINARSHKATGGSGWAVECLIEKHVDECLTRVARFSLEDIFVSRNGALDAALEFARRMVDTELEPEGASA